jgi:hypothetical protein
MFTKDLELIHIKKSHLKLQYASKKDSLKQMSKGIFRDCFHKRDCGKFCPH